MGYPYEKKRICIIDNGIVLGTLIIEYRLRLKGTAARFRGTVRFIRTVGTCDNKRTSVRRTREHRSPGGSFRCCQHKAPGKALGQPLGKPGSNRDKGLCRARLGADEK